MMMLLRGVRRSLLVFAIGFCISANAQTVFNLGYVYTGVIPANTATPWITAQFDDQNDGSVLLTLTGTPNLTNPEKIKTFYFNFDDSLNLNLLVGTYVSSSGQFGLPHFEKRSPARQNDNRFKAAGGYFDLRFDFVHQGGLANTFGAGDSLVYRFVYGGSNIGTDSFAFSSASNGSNALCFAAAHVQETPFGNSVFIGAQAVGSVTVPEPASATLLGLGTLLVFTGRRAKLTS